MNTGVVMPRFRIRMINSEFESCEETEFPSLQDASKRAIASGARVITESIIGGEERSAAVQLQIHQGERLVAHHVVSLSVADLLPRE
jgi:hypothetical protein